MTIQNRQTEKKCAPSGKMPDIAGCNVNVTKAAPFIFPLPRIFQLYGIPAFSL